MGIDNSIEFNGAELDDFLARRDAPRGEHRQKLRAVEKKKKERKRERLSRGVVIYSGSRGKRVSEQVTLVEARPINRETSAILNMSLGERRSPRSRTCGWLPSSPALLLARFGQRSVGEAGITRAKRGARGFAPHRLENGLLLTFTYHLHPLAVSDDTLYRRSAAPSRAILETPSLSRVAPRALRIESLRGICPVIRSRGAAKASPPGGAIFSCLLKQKRKRGEKNESAYTARGDLDGNNSARRVVFLRAGIIHSPSEWRYRGRIKSLAMILFIETGSIGTR